jgi:hypothetical protein
MVTFSNPAETIFSIRYYAPFYVFLSKIYATIRSS